MLDLLYHVLIGRVERDVRELLVRRARAVHGNDLSSGAITTTRTVSAT
jgi:hypothetical protein